MTTTTDQTTQMLLDAIRARRSFALNQLSPEPIDLAAIPLMLEAARWAPNHGLTEPWRFSVFAGERRQALSDAFGAAYRQMTPGPRDWYANLLAQPNMIFHVKEGAQADLPARATPITDATERRRILGAVMRSNSWFMAQSYDLDAWVAGSPLVEVEFE